MNSTVFAIAKTLLPRSLRRGVRRCFMPTIYSGDYRSWAEAAIDSAGYDDETIFRKTLLATRAVCDGRAAWERDGQLFDAPFSHPPLLEALRRVTASTGGRLSVLDFGGAFGSTWWQLRPWLSDLTEVRWNVVEQYRYVEVGRQEFTVGPLRFFHTLKECVVAENPTVLLLSSVLPYLEKPHDLLAQCAQGSFEYVIIDRTGFVTRGRDRLTVQKVPLSIYSGSYPCWFFDRATLLRPFAQKWRIANEWDAFGEIDIDADYCGLMLEREPESQPPT